MAKQDKYVRYTIRVPAELYVRVQDAAREKSVNAEIISRLESSFDVGDVGRLPPLLKAEVERAAKLNGVSADEEVLNTLRRHYPQVNLTDRVDELRDLVLALRKSGAEPDALVRLSTEIYTLIDDIAEGLVATDEITASEMREALERFASDFTDPPSGTREALRYSPALWTRPEDSESQVTEGQELPPEIADAVSRGEPVVRALREWRGMTETELARKSGFKVARLKDFEGGSRIAPEEAKLIAGALDVPMEWLC